MLREATRLLAVIEEKGACARPWCALTRARTERTQVQRNPTVEAWRNVAQLAACVLALRTSSLDVDGAHLHTHAALTPHAHSPAALPAQSEGEVHRHTVPRLTRTTHSETRLELMLQFVRTASVSGSGNGLKLSGEVSAAAGCVVIGQVGAEGHDEVGVDAGVTPAGRQPWAERACARACVRVCVRMFRCRARAPEVMILDVPEVYGLAHALVLVDVAHESKQIGVIGDALLVCLEVRHVDRVEADHAQ